MDANVKAIGGIEMESEQTSDLYLDVSQMDGVDRSLASIGSDSSSSDGGTDIKPQIREQFDRKY